MLAKKFELKALSPHEKKELSDRLDDDMFSGFDRIYQVIAPGVFWDTPKTVFFCVYEHASQGDTERKFMIAAYHGKAKVYLKSHASTSIAATSDLARQKTEDLRKIFKGQKIWPNAFIIQTYDQFEKIEPKFARMYNEIWGKYFNNILT